MSRFAGDDPRRIHHLERDAEFLLELPESVQVLEIVEAFGVVGPPAEGTRKAPREEGPS
jgi:hypothetical protein